MHEKAEIEKF